MSGLQELLIECETRSIRLAPAGYGGLAIDAPQGVLTPGLTERLKSNKAQLLTVLKPLTPATEATDPADWEAAIEPPDPCPKCGRLELWQSVASDPFGLTPGTWRCVRCDPPTTAKRLRQLVVRLRNQGHRIAQDGPKPRNPTRNTCNDSMRQTGS